jgi:hypothetical protein
LPPAVALFTKRCLNTFFNLVLPPCVIFNLETGRRADRGHVEPLTGRSKVVPKSNTFGRPLIVHRTNQSNDNLTLCTLQHGDTLAETTALLQIDPNYITPRPTDEAASTSAGWKDEGHPTLSRHGRRFRVPGFVAFTNHHHHHVAFSTQTS